ncbi:MAG: 3'(2'),5'-bisphosphate nucleotidase [Phycisphaerae bacterium]
MEYTIERNVAVSAVLKACRLCRSVQGALVSPQTLSKKDKSPVTVADFGSQAVISAQLRAAFPTVPLVGEEDAAELRRDVNAELREKVVHHVNAVMPGQSSEQVLEAIDHGTYSGGPTGRHWTLDPIDGTKGFLRGDQYAIALALIRQGQVVLGVLGCPNLPLDAGRADGLRGCLFVAVKDQGTTVRSLDDPAESPIQVTHIDDSAAASFCESVESAHSKHSDSQKVAQLLGVTAPPFRIDSQCKYAAVARGDSSIYLRLPTRADYQEKIWDHAAGQMVVTEAGGRVTDITGQPLDFSLGRTLSNNKGVVATNGRLHAPVLDALGSVLAGNADATQ